MTHQVASGGVDPITVGLVANRLYSILEEHQTALVNTAFSSIVRESYDLACAVFDSEGRMIGQSRDGTPGHINSMATGMVHIASRFPKESLREGDVLITNDPWMTAGQINDITVATPIFLDGAPVAWFASCCHSPDIGGRILSAAATEVYEEGLRLPILKLRTAEGPDETLEHLIRTNVRTPDETIGDIYAQVAANEVGGRALIRVMREFGLTEIDTVAAEIMSRSETALRTAIQKLRDGVYTATMKSDGFGDKPLELCVTVTISGDSMVVDYAGSSLQSDYGINVVLNYTRAYTSFAIKAAFAPEVPHNDGSFLPVKVTAPEGSILNCTEPAPVALRNLVGHFLPSLIFDALRPAVPEGLPASSSDALWVLIWRGENVRGDDLFTGTVFASGGSGARPAKDGLNTTAFPTGVRAAPTEVIETVTPLVQARRELRPDSGGAGEFRGGLGQELQVRRRGKGSWSVNSNIDRVIYPAPGTNGGEEGAAGRFTDVVDGKDLPRKQLVRLPHDGEVRFSFPGGGGYNDPLKRPVDRVFSDVVNGYVSHEEARKRYGVAIEYIGPREALVRASEHYRINETATAELRHP